MSSSSKTLTLKKTASSKKSSSSSSPRVRSGTRARRAAQARPRTAETTPANTAPAAVRPKANIRPKNAPLKTAPKTITQPATVPNARFSARQSDSFALFAPCPIGLEDALAAELQALHFKQVHTTRAGCSFSGTWLDVLRANLYSRLATRILVQVAYAPIHNEDELYELAYHTPWEEWFGPEQSLRVDTSAVRSPLASLHFANLRVKDAVCDRLRDQEGARPSVDTVRPDAKVHVFLDADSATLYIDSTGESLFKRGWRHHKGSAPLRENLAAGLLALSDWDPNAALMDPFCGSGTILIEAAWIALGAPPGIWRPFHFERLRHHDAQQWAHLKAEARSSIAAEIDIPLVGYDLDPTAIEAAKANLQRAHLHPNTIRFEVADALQMQPVADHGWIVSNPPYGERLAHSDEAFWSQFATKLKQDFSGWSVNLISSDLKLPSKLRLRPNRRHPVYNGPLDCRLFNFQMVPASNR